MPNADLECNRCEARQNPPFAAKTGRRGQSGG